MFPSLNALSSLTGGGGLSASSSATSGDAKGGDIGGSSFAFGGINTGQQSSIPPWLIAVAVAGIVLVLVLKR